MRPRILIAVGVAILVVAGGVVYLLRGDSAQLPQPPSGYKVVVVPFANGRPSGRPIYVLTGFLGRNGDALGRPVGVAVDKAGALLVADDVGNTVWRVTPAAQQAEP
jgi:glucose/arabinose dehydrogenase